MRTSGMGGLAVNHPILVDAIMRSLRRNGVMSYRALLADLGRSPANLSQCLRRLAQSGRVTLLDKDQRPLPMDRRRHQVGDNAMTGGWVKVYSPPLKDRCPIFTDS
jgi:Winged helix-turn-helix DNA-binding